MNEIYLQRRKALLDAKEGPCMVCIFSGSAPMKSLDSSYPFYVELDSTEGLILGQHVYLQLETQEAETPAGPSVGSAFIAYDDDGSTYVWADVERTEGADIEEEWRGTVGIRYSF